MKEKIISLISKKLIEIPEIKQIQIFDAFGEKAILIVTQSNLKFVLSLESLKNDYNTKTD